MHALVSLTAVCVQGGLGIINGHYIMQIQYGGGQGGSQFKHQERDRIKWKSTHRASKARAGTDPRLIELVVHQDHLIA